MTDTTYRDAASAGPLPTPGGPLSYIHWGPGILGAIVAAAMSFVLMGFAAADDFAHPPHRATPRSGWRSCGLLDRHRGVGSFALGAILPDACGRPAAVPDDRVSRWRARAGRAIGVCSGPCFSRHRRAICGIHRLRAARYGRRPASSLEP